MSREDADKKNNAEIHALKAARDNGIATVLFRNALARKLGVNLTESLCLTVLSIKNRSTPTELSRFTGMTSGAMTALLDRLENRRFIRRTPNPDDRRGVIIELDARYSQAAGDLVGGIQAAHKELISRYSTEELELISSFLEGFSGNMRRHARTIDGEMPWV